MSCQSRFDAQYWMLGAGALGRPRGMIQGGRREEGSGWGTHVYLWQIDFDIWQNQYNIVKFKNKIKLKKKKVQRIRSLFPGGSDSKESTCTAGDLGLIPGLGRSPGGGHGHPLPWTEEPNGLQFLGLQ